MANQKQEVKLLLSIEDALQFGLILCFCGHPPNNHFEHGTQPCAFCECHAYEMTARRGRLVRVAVDGENG